MRPQTSLTKQQSDQEKLFNVVVAFFEDRGLSAPIETLAGMMDDIVAEDKIAFVSMSAKAKEDSHFTMGQIILLLSKMYETTKDHLYTRIIDRSN